MYKTGACSNSRNMYCKNSLCKKETFADLAGWLIKDDIPLTQKRVTVYLLSALVANNKLGQMLAQTTGCLDLLLVLFRTSFPLSTDSTSVVANAMHTYQLWTSVSSALCGCVNNPQSEDGQHICATAFPNIKIWLQQVAVQHTEIFQSLCSFIAMTVANNSRVQESFSSSGGLKTLALSLARLTSVADVSLLSCQLCVTISKTLSACITDNTVLASGLARYCIVSHLISLLASPNLEPQHRLSVLLTLGHCTESSEEHQSHLVQSGGLPLIITLLAEDTSEEIRKAATFILQTCKQATMSLGVPVLTARHGKDENVESLINMESFKSSAKELLHRIDQLEKKQTKEVDDDQEERVLSTSTKGFAPPSLSPALHQPLQDYSIQTVPAAYRQTSANKPIEAESDDNISLWIARSMIMKENDCEKMSMSSKLTTPEDKAKSSGKRQQCSALTGTGSIVFFHVPPLEGHREPHMTDSELFKPVAPVRHSVPKEMSSTDKEELQRQEMSNVEKNTKGEKSPAHFRCAGCALPFEEVTSRTFASLQSFCRHSCEMHKALQVATERFRTCHRSLLLRREYQGNRMTSTSQKSERASSTEPQRSKIKWREVCLTPICKREGKGRNFLPAPGWKRDFDINLTPHHRRNKKRPSFYNKTGMYVTFSQQHLVLSFIFTVLKGPHLPEDKHVIACLNSRLRCVNVLIESLLWKLSSVVCSR
ncbi:telomere repeats-binding bouquet formation protein 1-like isoform X2 [Echeneis naucrates]|uniref:telomere repeats-binding bouquet formation protein 1-like isoform X2 n=1 Tax=Echeneis naucrates TaxID=173247 RepID=UPI001113AFE1|nr:telomere repeats-binding bouquet formation protein 1-like isoform X2 [Echeneis naucrates]